MLRNSQICLNAREYQTVSAILEGVRRRIGPIKVFGSRATGRARPASDLDLVVFPPAPNSELSNLRFAFDESDLPITVDIIAWESIESRALRDEILRHGILFFNDPTT